MLKKLLFFISFLFLLSPLPSRAQDIGWVIEEFSSTNTIQANGEVAITETIKVDFDGLQKHGIFRTIPVKYKTNKGNVSIPIRVFWVRDENGLNIPYKTSRKGNNVEIKIGDPDKTVSGKQTYVIHYEASFALTYFKDHDEFYWNVTGDQWPVPIEKASATVTLPESGINDAVCFIGVLGNKEKCSSQITSQNESSFASTRSISPGEGVTIAVSFKKGIVAEPTIWQKILKQITDNWIYFLPLLTLIVMFWVWWKFGRDAREYKTIVPEFAPPENIKPAEMGTLFDGKVDVEDFSTTIIDLAVRGYIKIKEIPKTGIFGKKDYEITLLKDYGDLGSYENDAISGFGFDHKVGSSVKLSELKNEYYKNITQMKKTLYGEMKNRNWFFANPEAVRNIYIFIGIAIISLGLWIGGFWGSAGYFGIIATGVIILLFSGAMPKRTPAGREMLRKIKGFKLYMETAERYRQQFYEKEGIFEKYLPYAMVFGIVDKWAKAFEGLDIKPPDWYEGTGTFNPVIFANNMNSFAQAAGSNLATAPGGGSAFGGGGGVGGGGGGGGGGSW